MSGSSNVYMRHRHSSYQHDQGPHYEDHRPINTTRYHQPKRSGDNGFDFFRQTLSLVHVPAFIVMSFIVVVIFSLVMYPGIHEGSVSTAPAPVYRVQVLERMPHNVQSYTQGLAFDEDEPGVLYESTGLYGKSRVSRVDLRNGSTLQATDNDPADFGEGLTFHGIAKNHLVQMLWKSGQGNVYDRYTLEHLYSFDAFDLKDGWGVAQVPEKPNCFYLTDGSNRIRMFELRANIKKAYVVKEFQVKDGEHPVGLLNEIEVVGDEIWANILFSEVIVKFNRYSGSVLGYLDMRQILHKSDINPSQKIDVLNGIAYNANNCAALVTGKLWPKVIAIQPQKEPSANNLIEAGIDPFFLNPKKVQYIFEHMLA